MKITSRMQPQAASLTVGYEPQKSSQDKSSQPLPWQMWMERIWTDWINHLTAPSEPNLWQTIDRCGNIWWHAHNPSTGRCATRESEIAILEWLDSARD